jgi:hypothetical protein
VELTDVYNTTPCDQILNTDESFWRMLYLRTKTVDPMGRETVKVNVNRDPKADLTPLGRITAAGTKSPLVLVAKGRTHLCHKQLAADLEH